MNKTTEGSYRDCVVCSKKGQYCECQTCDGDYGGGPEYDDYACKTCGRLRR